MSAQSKNYNAVLCGLQQADVIWMMMIAQGAINGIDYYKILTFYVKCYKINTKQTIVRYIF